jgi:hypothetical protein
MRRRRFGYRRLLVLLRREGFIVDDERLFRIYREERLTVRVIRTPRFEHGASYVAVSGTASR